MSKKRRSPPGNMNQSNTAYPNKRRHLSNSVDNVHSSSSNRMYDRNNMRPNTLPTQKRPQTNEIGTNTDAITSTISNTVPKEEYEKLQKKYEKLQKEYEKLQRQTSAELHQKSAELHQKRKECDASDYRNIHATKNQIETQKDCAALAVELFEYKPESKIIQKVKNKEEKFIDLRMNKKRNSKDNMKFAEIAQMYNGKNINSRSDLSAFGMCVAHNEEFVSDNNILRFPKSMKKYVGNIFEMDKDVLKDTIGEISQKQTISKKSKVSWEWNIKLNPDIIGKHIEFMSMKSKPLNGNELNNNERFKKWTTKQKTILTLWKDPNQKTGYRLSVGESASEHNNLLYFACFAY